MRQEPQVTTTGSASRVLRRRSLIPPAAIVAAIVSVVVVSLAVLAGVWIARSSRTEVPDVVGTASAIAQARIEGASLVFEVESSQVSVDVQAGSVISQDPVAGRAVAPGTVVRVVLSVGPQTLSVPDVIGLPLDQATAILESIGLEVAVETISSEATATVVLEMYPAPGATVSEGDEVRLTLPGEASSDVLLPYDLQGLSIVIDPLPITGAGTADVASDVSRRLQALLTAAGATVSVTRTTTETAPTTASRTAAARASGATLLIGIDLGRTGTPGLRALYPPPNQTDPARSESSRILAQSITRAARLPGFVVNEPQETNDVVLAGFSGTGVRVTIADSASESDRARMTDPAWADVVARAIYRGIGTTLGAD